MAKKGIENVTRSKRDDFSLQKRIPLHYQKRYLANFSNGSFNASLTTVKYRNKIKALVNNNRELAIALQKDKAKKEEMLVESKANASIIMFSRLKLASLSDNLKKVVTLVDETLALLQMHSSVSLSKFRPKNTLSREEFKEQVKEVLMDSIPEEPESPPQRKSNEANVEEVACQNKKQSDPVNKDNSPEFQVDMADKNHPPKVSKKSRKTLKHSNSNKRSSIQDPNKVYMNSDSVKHGYCQSNASVYNYDESSPAKTVATQLKKFSSKTKTFTSDVCNKKVVTGPKTNKKSCKVTKNTVWNDTKKASGINKDKNSSPLKYNLNQSKLSNGVQMTGNNSAKSGSVHAICKPKNSVSSGKLCGNITNDSYVISDCEKENANSKKRQKLSAVRFKSLDGVELEPTVTERTYSLSSGLKSLSSKINIENFKSNRRKNKRSPPLDDLITIKQKDGFMQVNNSSESHNTSRSYLQELTLYQQEMVRNLAENTFLVTAEVHKSLESNTTNKIKLPETKCSIFKQPVVLVQDIFKSSKSFCKSISPPACDELNRIPLELQLLQHCSSLKVIPEESIHSQDDSTDQTNEKVSRARQKNIEPPLSVEGEIMEQPLHEDKRTFHKRCGINYKEDQTEEEVSNARQKNIEPPLSVEGEFVEQSIHEDKRAIRKRSSINYKERATNIKLRR